VSRMSRFVPSARSFAKLSGAAVVGTAVAALFAAPAFAWSAGITPSSDCVDNGTVTVTWTVHNNESNHAATFEVTAHKPAASTLDKTSGDLAAGGDATIVQTGVPSEEKALIVVHVVWPKPDGHGKFDEQWLKGKFEGKKCEQPSPSPSPSETSPTGEGTPSPSTTAGTPTLPVTGPNAAIYGGGAAALLVAGGTLFVVARRRRIRFEA
jgi:hypothetical protein